MAEDAVAVTTTLADVVLGVLAVCVCYVLGWANRVLRVDVDAKVGQWYTARRVKTNASIGLGMTAN